MKNRVRILKFAILFLWIVIYHTFPEVKYFLSSNFNLKDNIWFTSFFSFIQDIFVFELSLILLIYLGKDLFSNIRFNKDLLKIIPVFFLITIGLYFIEHFIINITENFSDSTLEQGYLYDNYLIEDFKSRFIWIIIIAIPTSISEEFFFRALCYDVYKEKYGKFISIILNSIIFVAFHPEPVLIPAFFIGNIIICIAYDYTRNLLVPIFIHFMYNVIPVALLFFI